MRLLKGESGITGIFFLVQRNKMIHTICGSYVYILNNSSLKKSQTGKPLLPGTVNLPVRLPGRPGKKASEHCRQSFEWPTFGAFPKQLDNIKRRPL